MGSRLAALISIGLVVSACATGRQPELPGYAGEVEVYLEPFDDRELCRLHVALRNVSGARQGFSEFLVSWRVRGGELPDTRLQHNAMREGMLRSASADLPLPCGRIEQMHIDTATWELFEGWDNPSPTRVRIDGAQDTDWRFSWNAELGVYAGSRPAMD